MPSSKIHGALTKVVIRSATIEMAAWVRGGKIHQDPLQFPNNNVVPFEQIHSGPSIPLPLRTLVRREAALRERRDKHKVGWNRDERPDLMTD
jgi:hypothetical protein